MFIIGEITVDPSVSGTKFACDLDSCKGACCTFPGGRGAPLADTEVIEIERAYPVIKRMSSGRAYRGDRTERLDRRGSG
jgi:hypothetical protein